MADLDPRVCPDCGKDDFYQRVNETREYSVSIIGAHGEAFDKDDGEVMASEREHDTVTCRDCGWEGDPSDTITELEYRAENEEGNDE